MNDLASLPWNMLIFIYWFVLGLAAVGGLHLLRPIRFTFIEITGAFFIFISGLMGFVITAVNLYEKYVKTPQK